ncbi:hypothetical protein CGMCC3_g11506 [Colletotrichum fructicola]|uniref:Copia protein n=1 Tax=Colletotrichum fructicola (strain Nara gc5) TaxID=1213859 RepID=A0A7J6J7E1_COLFN|nr:uncharacterized protein CGMCC3_g11506 [Colletotrichum fructicola]KAE9572511.1 hypothetical protein CGMCC3_g11506 [Colletotrichum fructicola]KAF4484819.1 Copia protein [Colletotrichum fructicola Nara gc5]
MWHRRLGHPGPEAIRHLVGSSRGVRLLTGGSAISTIDCDACGTSKLHRQVRRAVKEALLREKPADRIAIDFHDYDEGYEGYRYTLLVTDRSSSYTWDFYLTRRTTDVLLTVITDFLTLLSTQYGARVKVIETDNEILKHPRVVSEIESRGIRLEPCAPNTQAQNGGAERIAATIKQRARAMASGAKLPDILWPEATKASTYLYNRTPTASRGWRTPYEVFHKHFWAAEAAPYARPDLSHLRAYGCKAFAMTRQAQLKQNRRQRLAPRAFIGYLVGYSSSNCFRIWNPLRDEVFTTRDVVFNEKQFFNGNLKELAEEFRYMDLQEIQERITQLIDQTNRTTIPQDADEEADEVVEDYEHAELSDIAALERGTPPPEDALYTKARFQLMTPPETPPPPSAFFTALRSTLLDVRGREHSDHPSKTSEDSKTIPPLLRWAPRTSFKAAFLAGSAQPRAQKTYKDKTKRSMDGPADCCTWADHPLSARVGWEASETTTGVGCTRKAAIDEIDLQQGASAVAEQKPESERHPRSTNTYGAQRSPLGDPWRTLPALPTSHDQLAPRNNATKAHPFAREFLEAEQSHLRGHETSRSWREVAKSEARGHQVLGCHWVYTYELDKHGRLAKFKARLVIRGDQQAKDARDTYAATLAGMSFRILMALAARFDMELLQYDAVNAFVHATLDETVFMQLPPGYRRPGVILRLQKALCGLRRSPILWQRHLEAGLRALGFSRVAGENCCWQRGQVTFFFYVDDCVLAFPREHSADAQEAINALQKRYHLEGGKDLQWFLGIEVIRDRSTRKLWLSQAVFAEKVRKLITPRADNAEAPEERAYTPMTKTELFPYDGEAAPWEINHYQKRVGTILYAAVMTRPDIAFAASRLARFNHNPGPTHHKAVERVLRYLYNTRYLCLEYGATPGSDDDTLEVASDASFADNTLDRKSSQAFAMKLFGGIVAWKANKQTTVTTSTTEAELLSLSQAAREALFASRLIGALQVQLPTESMPEAQFATPTRTQPTIQIQCDNQQTVRLVNAELVQLQTRLRHVDIHNHWLRQEIAEHRVSVAYTPSAQLMADGLTKALALPQFKIFCQQLRLSDQRALLKRNRECKLVEEDERQVAEAMKNDVWDMEARDLPDTDNMAKT